MVEISNKHKSITVGVSSNNGNTVVTASSDSSQYWANQSHTFANYSRDLAKEAKEWANKLEGTVDGKEYSAKHYAELASSYIEGFENIVTENTNNIITTSNDYINQITEITNAGAADINTAKDLAVEGISNTKTAILNDIEFVAEGAKEEIEDLVDTGKDELKEAIGDVKVLTTLEIGDIGIAPLGIDETKGKRRYLNGQLIIQDQYVQFTNKVKSAVALYPSLACTEEEWQTTATMTVGGQVGKFVVDDEGGTIRLPKIIMPIQGLTDLSKLAEIVEAGLPNITGRHAGHEDVGFAGHITGCFVDGGDQGQGAGSGAGSGNLHFIDFDASLSNPIYGNSTTVQQEQIQYPYFIQVATGAETEDNIINEIELNNPFSLLDVKWSDKLLNNVSWLRSNGQSNSSTIYPAIYDLVLTEYNNGTDETETVGGTTITFRRGATTGIKVTTDKASFDSILSATGTAWYYVLDTANSAFYLPQSDGFLQFGGDGNFVEAGLPNITGTFGGIENTGFNPTGAFADAGTGKITGGATSGNAGDPTVSFNASRSNAIYGNSNTVQPNAVQGYLYFYVGETVQNANLINAGRIEEKLVDKVDTNASNFTADGKSLISSLGIPSSRYIDLTLGATTSTYTMPANGWLYFRKRGASGTYASVSVPNQYGYERTLYGNNSVFECLLPVLKDTIVQVDYSLAGDTEYFRFIYAEGEV